MIAGVNLEKLREELNTNIPELKINDAHKAKYFSKRKAKAIDTIIVHHTAGRYPGDFRTLLGETGSKVSVHYYIRRTGEIYRMVSEADNAWHCGVSAWDYDRDGIIESQEGEKWINHRSIGIELESMGKTYTNKQYLSLVLLVANIINRCHIHPENVLGHKDVSPGRKIDPANFDLEDLKIDAAFVLYQRYGYLYEDYLKKIKED